MQDQQQQEQQRHAIICAGLNCLDLQLLGCTKSGQEEAIEQYDAAVYCAGGSAPMAATALCQILGKNEDDATTTTAASTADVYILTKLGDDQNGHLMLELMRQQCGTQATELCLVDPKVATAMSVLPIFKTGGRQCFFNLASNTTYTADDLIQQLHQLVDKPNTTVDAFLFGYPHLLPKLQGDNLRNMLATVRLQFQMVSQKRPLIGMDLNGVSAENHNDQVLGPALEYVDVLHLNEEEAQILSGVDNKHDLMNDPAQLKQVCHKIHQQGCVLVVLSMGARGSFLSVTSDAERLSKSAIAFLPQLTPDQACTSPAFLIQNEINTNGAGDALFAAFGWVAATQSDLTLEQAGQFASLVAHQRCDTTTRDAPRYKAHQLLDMVKAQHLPPEIVSN